MMKPFDKADWEAFSGAVNPSPMHGQRRSPLYGEFPILDGTAIVIIDANRIEIHFHIEWLTDPDSWGFNCVFELGKIIVDALFKPTGDLLTIKKVEALGFRRL